MIRNIITETFRTNDPTFDRAGYDKLPLVEKLRTWQIKELLEAADRIENLEAALAFCDGGCRDLAAREKP